MPFSKSVAINDAASRARSDILVMVDADCYIDANVVRACAEKIRLGKVSWSVPYSMLFRLTRKASDWLMGSSPRKPHKLYDYGLDKTLWEDTATSQYGAMIQMFPRQAFDLVGGMDERFRGWGGEDHAFLRSLDTLYGEHQSSNNFIYHLWHSHPGSSPTTRTWAGQAEPRSNYELIRKYRVATGKPLLMRRLLNERER